MAHHYKIYSFTFAMVVFFCVLGFIYQPIVAHVFSSGGNVFSRSNTIIASASDGSVDSTSEVSRAITSEEISTTPVTIVFVGDIMLSRAIGRIMEKRQDWTYPFAFVKDFLSSADLAVGNLEGPLSERGNKVGSIYSFRANPKSVAGLVYAGFDIMSIANNHIWDYGKDAFLDTTSILSANQIGYVGGGKNYEEVHIPLVRDVNGTRIAFLSYTSLLPKFLGAIDAAPAIAFPDIGQMTTDIKNAKKVADIVVVSFHFGNEYETVHNIYQEELAHSAVDAGAQVVIGHHPHVVEDIEVYHGAHIAYSLGNFVFDQNFSPDTGKGLAVKVTIKDKKVVFFETYDVGFNTTYQPSVVKK